MNARRRLTAVSILLTLVIGLMLGGAWGASPSDAPLIRLQYATFDPLAGEPDIPSGQRLRIQADRPATYIVQFAGPVREEWKSAVEQAGAYLYGYIPDYAFLARMTLAAAEQVRALSFVRWVGPYHPAYRLSSELRVASGEEREAIEGSEAITVTVQTLPDIALDALSTEIEGLGGKILGQAANPIAGYVRVVISPERLEALAALDEVLWVEPY
ncbi:MAG TPA: hypothetical protein ENG33_06085, partial [Chloroflexi bacterium]|nr:hypothetical protein [Chloroflexota bacterium]